MSEDRLEIVKENAYMRSEIAKNSRLGIDTSLREELELLKEIERLNNIIDELEKWLIENIDEYRDMEKDAMFEFGLVLDKLKALKEDNK